MIAGSTLTETEVVALLAGYFASLFPKSCTMCGHSYASLAEWIRATRPTGRVQSIDAELGDWHTPAPLGSFALAACACGTTLALSTERMAAEQRVALLGWLRNESEQTGAAPAAVLDRIREGVRRLVMAGEPQ